MHVESSQSGEAEAVILIKASPNPGRSSETVCCAGIDLYGRWLRLYPVVFRRLDEQQRFGRWDRVHFKWRRPRNDPRVESRRVEEDSLQIVGELKANERASFLAKSVVTSLVKEREQGRSLALLQVEVKSFRIERKTDGQVAREQNRFDLLARQHDIFSKRISTYRVCPYEFRYRYSCEDRDREGTCQDWETDATFHNWAREYGERGALDRMSVRFGEEYPRDGIFLAMGTHSRRPDQWLINGIIRLDAIRQLSLF